MQECRSTRAAEEAESDEGRGQLKGQSQKLQHLFSPACMLISSLLFVFLKLQFNWGT